MRTAPIGTSATFEDVLNAGDGVYPCQEGCVDSEDALDCGVVVILYLQYADTCFSNGTESEKNKYIENDNELDVSLEIGSPPQAAEADPEVSRATDAVEKCYHGPSLGLFCHDCPYFNLPSPLSASNHSSVLSIRYWKSSNQPRRAVDILSTPEPQETVRLSKK